MNSGKTWPKPLLSMIESSHSKEMVDKFCAYEPDEIGMNALAEISRGLLDECQFKGGFCTLASALLASTLEEPLGLTLPVVAGALKVGGEYMYGSNHAFDGRRVFSESSDDWDGHCWILLGRFVVDISLGRTARNRECRAPLSRAVISAFGPNVGMIAVTDMAARQAGLLYLPRYVLTPDQVLGLAGGAIKKFGL